MSKVKEIIVVSNEKGKLVNINSFKGFDRVGKKKDFIIWEGKIPTDPDKIVKFLSDLLKACDVPIKVTHERK